MMRTRTEAVEMQNCANPRNKIIDTQKEKITHTKGRNVHRTRSPVIRQAFMHTHDAVNDHRRTGSNI